MPVGDSVAGLALGAEEGLLIDDVDRDERCAGRARRGRYASGSALLVPLRGAQGALGVLCATERPPAQPFAEEDLALARLLALRGGAAPRARAPVAAPPPARRPSIPTRRCAWSSRATSRRRSARRSSRARCCARRCAPSRSSSGRRRSRSTWSTRARDRSRSRRSAGDARSDRPRLPRDRGPGGARAAAAAAAWPPIGPSSQPGFAADVDTPEDGAVGPLYCVPIAIRGRVLGLARVFLPAGATASLRTGELLGTALSAAVRNALLYRSLLESIDDLARARRESNERRG